MKKQLSISLQEYPMEQIVAFCGLQDKHLQVLREVFACDVLLRDGDLQVLYEDEENFVHIQHVVDAIFDMLRHEQTITYREIEYICRLEKLGQLQELSFIYQQPVGKTINGKLIYPKTIGQRKLFQCMRKSEIVFASGVAGTGKTYLAVVYAANLLKKRGDT